VFPIILPCQASAVLFFGVRVLCVCSELQLSMPALQVDISRVCMLFIVKLFVPWACGIRGICNAPDSHNTESSDLHWLAAADSALRPEPACTGCCDGNELFSTWRVAQLISSRVPLLPGSLAPGALYPQCSLRLLDVACIRVSSGVQRLHLELPCHQCGLAS
jgi:hypothetical protein